MAKGRIMVVDGSNVSREIVTRILANVMEDAEITACASGREALDKLAQGHHDLITTSLVLPDMDGLDFCRTIRQSDEHHSTPLIVISGDANQRLLQEGFAAGVTDYFDKSQGYPAFGTFIKSFCQRNCGMVGRVLFVEDSLTAAAVTKRMMERQGLEVIHVTSAEGALQRFEAMQRGEESFDAVITDFFLKDEMTGGDLLYAIRARYHFSQQQLPVLIMTGKDDIQTQIDSFHAGANDFVQKPLVEEILIARLRSLLLVKQQYDALQRQASSIEQVANTDALTGVYNRRYLLDHGPAFYNDCDRQPIWAIIIDIDHIKQINDTRGHLVGDHVLASIGQTVRSHFAEGMVVRFGGEEFAVLLPNAETKRALVRAEMLRQQVEQLKPDGVPVTISIGMASGEEHPEADLNQLIRLADQALAAAKEGGRNRLFVTDGQGAQRAPRFQAAS